MSKRRTAILRKFVITGLSALALLPVYGQALAMGGGMMGMGHGMMGMGGGQNDTSVAPVNPAKSEALLAYIKKQHLLCLQCHTISKAAIGPSFAAIATNYARQNDAKQVLSKNIAYGIRNMPSGLATESQAKQLANLIMDLYAAESTKDNDKNE